MLKRQILMLLGLLLVLSCAIAGKPWEKAEDMENGMRFIPIELWSGERWDGERDLVMRAANFRFGSRNHKVIRGPLKWKHPVTGQQLVVYERINETTKGTKRQLFTLNPDKTGLAKVLDTRPGHDMRYQTDNAVLFPLGGWKKGERREFFYDEVVGDKKYRRTATLRMRRLSFTYKGEAHAMKYDWIMRDVQGKIVFHERYIYAPGKGLMYYKNRLKKKNRK